MGKVIDYLDFASKCINDIQGDSYSGDIMKRYVKMMEWLRTDGYIVGSNISSLIDNFDYSESKFKGEE